uniref:Uncharacterized protein n=1 Tax=Anguilla anguilla TaxID=7936 RepID=A0A0E9WBT3_ANGAN
MLPRRLLKNSEYCCANPESPLDFLQHSPRT